MAVEKTAATESAVPAELAWTSADAASVGGNRLNEEGITDPECGMLTLRGLQDHRLLAMAVVYGMHPTVLHEDSTLVSADFPEATNTVFAPDSGCILVDVAVDLVSNIGGKGNP